LADGGTPSRLLLTFISILVILGLVTATQHSATTAASDQRFPYYTINVSPQSLSVIPGSTTRAAITVTSLNGFRATTQCGSAWWGHLDLSATVSSSATSGLSAVVNPSCLTLKSDQTVNATLVVSAAGLAALGRYNVIVGVGFQVSPSGWSAGSSTTVLVTIVSDGHLPTILTTALAGGAVAAGAISGVVLVRREVHSVKRHDDSGALRATTQRQTGLRIYH
jgi:hypothetical protein